MKPDPGLHFLCGPGGHSSYNHNEGATKAFPQPCSPCSRSQQLAGFESFLPLVIQCGERKQGLLLLQRARAFDNIKLFRLDVKPDFVENHMVLKRCCCLASLQGGKQGQIPQYLQITKAVNLMKKEERLRKFCLWWQRYKQAQEYPRGEKRLLQ